MSRKERIRLMDRAAGLLVVAIALGATAPTWADDPYRLLTHWIAAGLLTRWSIARIVAACGEPAMPTAPKGFGYEPDPDRHDS